MKHLLQREIIFIWWRFLVFFGAPFLPIHPLPSITNLPNQILLSPERLTVAALLSPPSLASVFSVVLTCAPLSVPQLGPGLVPELVLFAPSPPRVFL